MGLEEKSSLSQHLARVSDYYLTFESRIGYWIVLGGTKHFGYWPENTLWPFPLGRALRVMEDLLFRKLDLPAGSKVLDAGCGEAYVAMNMARKGLYVTAGDLTVEYLRMAERNVKENGLEDLITCKHVDYHDLSQFPDASFDGVYTMETFVHAFEPEKALKEFYRVLRPGGSLVLFEYSHIPLHTVPEPHLVKSLTDINDIAGMPSFKEDGWLLERIRISGFSDVHGQDVTKNVRPLARLFYLMALVPYWIFIVLLGMKYQFSNTYAGYCMYKGRKYWKYVVFSAKKPAFEQEEEQAVAGQEMDKDSA